MDGEDEMERQARLMQERMKNGPTPKKQKVKQGQQVFENNNFFFFLRKKSLILLIIKCRNLLSNRNDLSNYYLFFLLFSEIMNNIWEVIPNNLFFGCLNVNKETLRMKNIYSVFAFGQINQVTGILYRLRSSSNIVLDELVEICDQLDSDLKEGPVIILCHDGISLSPSIVIAYLMSKMGKRYEEAFYILKAIRPMIHPVLDLKKQLIRFQEILDETPRLRIQFQNMDTFYSESPKLEENTEIQQSKTPVFNSPANKFVRSNSTKKRSISLMNFGNNLNNSFRVDEINEDDNIESDLPSPIFKEDIGIVRMRKRRLKH